MSSARIWTLTPKVAVWVLYKGLAVCDDENVIPIVVLERLRAELEKDIAAIVGSGDYCARNIKPDPIPNGRGFSAKDWCVCYNSTRDISSIQSSVEIGRGIGVGARRTNPMMKYGIERACEIDSPTCAFAQMKPMEHHCGF